MGADDMFTKSRHLLSGVNFITRIHASRARHDPFRIPVFTWVELLTSVSC